MARTMLFLAAGLAILMIIPTSASDTEGAVASTAAMNEPTTQGETEPPPIVCTDPREVYDVCGSACGDRMCETIRRSEMQCSKQCVEGCYCRTGYARNKANKCIPAYRCDVRW